MPGPCRFLHTDQLRRVGDVLQTYLRNLMEDEENNIERLADGVIEMHKHFFKTIVSIVLFINTRRKSGLC